MPTVYVLGLEPFNYSLLEQLPGADEMTFRELLSAHESTDVEHGFSFDRLVETASERLRRGDPADAIVNYFDFPGVCLAPLLSRTHGLPGPDLEAVAALEHKHWARREMAAAVPEVTPRFCAVDPFADDAGARIDLDYPFWLKPIVSHSSYLGFKISDEEDLRVALEATRADIGLFGNPFNEFLKHVNVPASLEGVGGLHCIAEEMISADAQVTLEGYVFNGEVVVYGCIDSIREGHSESSFSRYEYPSVLPDRVLGRMKDCAARLLTHVGYDNAAFNMEFFWDEETDRISLLEANSRISKSHSPLFLRVDGASNQKIVVDLALGRRPDFPHRQGSHPLAAKFMVRLFQDGEMKRIPSASELHYVQSRYPDALIQVLVKEGERLSHLKFQDSYSFEIADLFFGGDNDEEMRAKFADAMEVLPFEVHLTAPVPE